MASFPRVTAWAAPWLKLLSIVVIIIMQVCFSPDETLALTGTSATRADADGSLVMFDWREQRLVRRLGVSGSVIAVQWHPRINQILVGSGDRKSGQARVLYSPSISQRGATLAVGRKPRPANPFDLEVRTRA